MSQSKALARASRGPHVAIIMDGNGRWAMARGLPREAGHLAGVESVRRVVAVAPGLGVGTLTLYAFSCDNWTRADSEVTTLMHILEDFLRDEAAACAALGVRVGAIGRRDRIPPSLVEAIETAEGLSGRAERMELRLAIDYSGREAIWRAARLLGERPSGPEASRIPAASPYERFEGLLGEASGAEGPAPAVDLVIRTGGERRLSDFLLWESAYAELYFTERTWPEFTGADFEVALADYARRERRFGGPSRAG